MKFTLEIDCDNDAFVEDVTRELKDILQEVAIKVYRTGPVGTIKDINGNTVGTYDWVRSHDGESSISNG